MTHMEQAQALRASKEKYYNCAQSILGTFARELGLETDEAARLGAHFGAGMRSGSVCGTLTGALMVLGALGYDEKASGALLRDFRARHGTLNCAELLSDAKERGVARKDHCDALVYEMVAELEKTMLGL